MKKENLEKGTRVFYGGDMANDEGLGVITRQITDKWGTCVDIKMDDGRDMNGLSIVLFSDEYLGHGGTRFVTEEAYRDFRQAEISKVEAALAKLDAGKKLTVKLSSCGNPDFPGQKTTDRPAPNQELKGVESLAAASLICTTYIAAWDLGGGNWTGGQVLQHGTQIARVSYNGRVWDMDDNEIQI